MAGKRIYHLCRQADWLKAMAKGVYEGSEQDRSDGFLHFSTSDQIEESAARHRAGEADLLLLSADSAGFGDNLRWEASAGGESYPHLYAPLPISAVLEVVPLVLDADGTHIFPLLTD
jgi:uncharacterized protein (DUF952 family)